MTVRERYEAAIAALTETLRRDRTILGAVLFGSLAYDEVWEKSDIDLHLIGEESVKPANYTLTADGISIHAYLMPRSQFKKIAEGSVQGGFMNSTLARSRLLFSKDDSLTLLFENAGPLGARDRQAQLLTRGIECLLPLTKAQKWFTVKRDYDYATVYLLHTAGALARVETIAAGDNPGREAIHQALRHNPTFFRHIYTDLLHGPKDAAAVGDALAAIDRYLTERIDLLFEPILDYLADAGGPRGTREINEHFSRHWGVTMIDAACDFLVEKGRVAAVGVPLRLTKDSRVTVDEAGYALVF
jgi:hypothetical protein